jgi:hypothetical protein
MLKRILAAVGTVGITFSLQAQSIPGSVTDPSCSPRNYKHANKSAPCSEETYSVKAYNYRIQRALYTLRKVRNYKAAAHAREIIRTGGVALSCNAFERNLNPLLSRNFYKGIKRQSFRKPMVQEEDEAI